MNIRHVSTAFAACCLAVVVIGLASVHPTAGQETAVGAARHPLDARAPLAMGTRFRVASTSAPWETWGPGGQPPLTESWGPGPRARREVQLVSGQKERSIFRTTTGALVALLGLAVVTYGYLECEVGGPDAALYTAVYGDDGCVLEPYPDWRHDVFTEHAPNYGVVAGGVGTMALGVLLTTVWSDVEVRRSQRGVEVAMSIWSR